jgi:hypothetical protein
VRRAEESVRRAREGRKRALYQQQGTLAEREEDASTDRPESTADNSHHGHLWNYTAGRSVLQLPRGGSHSPSKRTRPSADGERTARTGERGSRLAAGQVDMHRGGEPAPWVDRAAHDCR